MSHKVLELEQVVQQDPNLTTAMPLSQEVPIAITEVKYSVALTQVIPLDQSQYLVVLLLLVIMEVILE